MHVRFLRPSWSNLRRSLRMVGWSFALPLAAACSGGGGGTLDSPGPELPAPAGPALGNPSAVGGELINDRLLRLLPLGDSITLGTGFPGGYRVPLWLRCALNGVEIDYVGTQTEGSPFGFIDPQHEGYNGWRVSDLLDFDGQGVEPDSSIETILANTQPEAILLHIGTNDMLVFDGWHLAAKQLGLLLDRIWAVNPRIQIYLATIVPTSDGATNLAVDWYNRRVASIAHQRFLDGRRIELVDIAALSALSTSDGIHPTPETYAKMSIAWFQALVDGTQPVPPPPSGPLQVPFVVASATSTSPGYSPEMAVDGTGLDGELHDFEPVMLPLGWRSAEFDQIVDANGIGVPVGDGPTVTLRLPQRVDVRGLRIWNGRNVDIDGQVWANLESIARIRLESSANGVEWIDRGATVLTPGPGRSKAPFEELAVDWPNTRLIRIHVESTYGSLSGSPGPLFDSVSLSEIQVLANPLAPTEGNGPPTDFSVQPRRFKGQLSFQ